MDPRKAPSVVEWAPPASRSEVRRFTGLADYYRVRAADPVEDAPPVAAGPARVERGAFRSAGRLLAYYRRCVEGYSVVAAPLTALGSPTARVAWSPAAQASSDALKPALSSAPVLRTSWTRPAARR